MFRTWLVLMIVGLPVGYLAAATGNEHTFELKWQKDGFHETITTQMDRSEPFTKEPDFGERKILRGQLHIGPSHEEQVGFAWDTSEHKLYVDLNRDGDLTNDPNGVLNNNSSHSGSYQYENFPLFPLAVSTPLGIHRYDISAYLYDYPGSQSAQFTIHSGYAGDIKLHDNPWRFSVVDKLRTAVSQGNPFSIQPGADNSEVNRFDSLPAPQSLFLDGRCYDVRFEFKATGDSSPVLSCILKEKEVPLGKLRLEGQGINRLVFGNGDLLIVPRLSDKEMMVPVGNFRANDMSFKIDDQRYASPLRIEEILVPVTADGDNVLRVGGPLNHQVKIQRTGSVLQFNYELRGIGGETYDARQITNYNNEQKPSVAIYQGDMQVGGGSFEYG